MSSGPLVNLRRKLSRFLAGQRLTPSICVLGNMDAQNLVVLIVPRLNYRSGMTPRMRSSSIRRLLFVCPGFVLNEAGLIACIGFDGPQGSPYSGLGS